MSRSTAGPVVGLLALLGGLAVAELVVGLVRTAPSPVVAVGDAVIDAAPAGVSDWAIQTFGSANKTVLVVGTLAVLAVLAAVAGRWALLGRRSAVVVATGVAVCIGVVAVVSGAGAGPIEALPTLVGGVVAGAVLLAAPATLATRARAGATTEPPTGDPPHTTTSAGGGVPAVPMGVDRRRLLGGSALFGVAALAVGGLGRALQRRFEVSSERAGLELPSPSVPASLPADADLELDGLTPFVTPADDFFRIDTVLVVPQVSVDEWRLRITGMVDREIELTFDDLVAREPVERYVTISCVSNEVGGGLIGNARWQGVLLADVLREAGVDPAAEQLVSRSVDGWTCGTPVSAVLDGRDAMLAYAMNGEPLPDRHGYPVRMVVPGLFGYVSATKWVSEIELTTWDAFDAYWATRGWAEQAPVKTMTRVDRPRRESTWPAGPLDLAGVAWAVHRGISAVEVRIDDGPWTECELAGVPSDDTWRQWRYRWDATPGEHVVEARAVDGDGVRQPSDPRPPAPDGAQGYHRVRFTVR